RTPHGMCAHNRRVGQTRPAASLQVVDPEVLTRQICQAVSVRGQARKQMGTLFGQEWHSFSPAIQPMNCREPFRSASAVCECSNSRKVELRSPEIGVVRYLL